MTEKDVPIELARGVAKPVRVTLLLLMWILIGSLSLWAGAVGLKDLGYRSQAVLFAFGLFFLVGALVTLLNILLRRPKTVLHDGFLIHIGVIRKVALDLRDLGEAHLNQYRIKLSKSTRVLFFTADEEAAMLHARIPITAINASKQHDITIQTGNDLAKAQAIVDAINEYRLKFVQPLPQPPNASDLTKKVSRRPFRAFLIMFAIILVAKLFFVWWFSG